MIDQLDALRALRDTGTTALAAARLRITQSAVSKRISGLETSVGAPLVERHGRRLRLTGAGERLLTEATPLLVRLRELVEAQTVSERPLVLGSTESILGSWLPERLAGLSVELHVHRGPLLLERVRAGALEVAIGVESPTDLLVEPIGREAMVLVGAEPPVGPLEIATIEEHSLTGMWLTRRLPKVAPHLRVVRRLESFPVLTRLAIAGFGHSLVPLGIAHAMGALPAQIHPIPGLARPLAMACRKSTRDRPNVEALLARLRALLPGV